MKTEYQKSVDNWVANLDPETIANYLMMEDETFTEYECQVLLMA